MIFCWKKFAFGTFTFHFIEIHDFSGRFPFFSLNSTSTDYDLNLNLRQHGKFRKCSCVNIQNGLDHVTAAMYGDQCTEGSLDDDTLVFHLDVDSHATSGHWQVCALWILSTSRFPEQTADNLPHFPGNGMRRAWRDSNFGRDWDDLRIWTVQHGHQFIFLDRGVLI